MTQYLSDTQLFADYDQVGSYSQDKINGLTESLLDQMLDLADLKNAAHVLDAMGGDGNLTLRVQDYCQRRGITAPHCTLLEFSRIQAEFAKSRLPEESATVVWGDILTMKSLDTGESVGEGVYDRILIKSANHEIPLAEQEKLYQNLFKALKPGGLLINLGFLFDDVNERDELASIARVKDRLAGMQMAAERRHFLTRDEFYDYLKKAKFRSISKLAFDYKIRSDIVSNYYFPPEERFHSNFEFQASQVRARNLRKNKKMRFDGEETEMIIPGEITVAVKPMFENSSKIFGTYNYEFMRNIHMNAEMLDKVATYIPENATVIDLACGPGFLADRLVTKAHQYLGVDLSKSFIDVCQERLEPHPNFSFQVGNVNTVEIGEETADVVTVLNVLNLGGVKPVDVLEKCFEAVKPGGRIVVTGPTSSQSFDTAEVLIRAQLERDGYLQTDQQKSDYESLKQANKKFLSEKGNYWSEEGMIELLRHLGFLSIHALDTGIYENCYYLVVADKPSED